VLDAEPPFQYPPATACCAQQQLRRQGHSRVLSASATRRLGFWSPSPESASSIWSSISRIDFLGNQPRTPRDSEAASPYRRFACATTCEDRDPVRVPDFGINWRLCGWSVATSIRPSVDIHVLPGRSSRSPRSARGRRHQATRSPFEVALSRRPHRRPRSATAGCPDVRAALRLPGHGVKPATPWAAPAPPLVEDSLGIERLGVLAPVVMPRAGRRGRDPRRSSGLGRPPSTRWCRSLPATMENRRERSHPDAGRS